MKVFRSEIAPELGHIQNLPCDCVSVFPIPSAIPAQSAATLSISRASARQLLRALIAGNLLDDDDVRTAINFECRTRLRMTLRTVPLAPDVAGAWPSAHGMRDNGNL
jgi:hypothetical protein